MDNKDNEQETRIAIADPDSGQWQYFSFPTWNEARDAVNKAREQGKAAVFYDGATPISEPPINPDLNVET